jgi:hypothetical protein
MALGDRGHCLKEYTDRAEVAINGTVGEIAIDVGAGTLPAGKPLL